MNDDGYAGVRCACLITGCQAGPGCPNYDLNCKQHIAHRRRPVPVAAPAPTPRGLLTPEEIGALYREHWAGGGHLGFARAVERAVKAKLLEALK